MEKYVIKRNGEYKPFQEFKIKEAILKGFNSVNTDYDEEVLEKVILSLQIKDTWAVEEIQDTI